MLKRITKLPPFVFNVWEFCVSVADNITILIIAKNKSDGELIIRYYQDEDLAKAFILECANGKHSP